MVIDVNKGIYSVQAGTLLSGKAKSLFNGAGLTNGNELDQGCGFVNESGIRDDMSLCDGNGLINGNGLVGPREIQETGDHLQGSPARAAMNFVLHQARRKRPWQITLMLVLLLLTSSYWLLLSTPEKDEIRVDGSFEDWKGARLVEDRTETANPSMDLTAFRALEQGASLVFYLQTREPLFQSPGDAGDTIRLLVDRDGEENTGYVFPGFGADLMVEIGGREGKIQSSWLYRFDPAYRTQVTREENDWNAWAPLFQSVAASNARELELLLWKNELNLQPGGRFLFMLSDGNGNLVRSRVFDTGLSWLELNVLPGDTTQPLAGGGEEQVLELLSTSWGEPMLEELVFSLGSSTTETGISSFSLYLEDEFLAESLPQDGVLAFRELGLRLKSEDKLRLCYELSKEVQAGTVLSLELETATCRGNLVSIAGEPVRFYLREAPETPMIDGLFAEWKGAPEVESGGTRELRPLRAELLDWKEQSFLFLELRSQALAGCVIPAGRPFQTRTGAAPTSTAEPASRPQKIPELPARAGEDQILIFLSTRNATGYEIQKDFRASHLLELTGQYGEILCADLKIFTGQGPGDWNWKIVSSIEAMVSGTRTELSFPGLEEVSALVHVVSWSGKLASCRLGSGLPSQFSQESRTAPVSGTSLGFGEKVDVGNGGTNIWSMTSADLDRDGDLDIITGSASTTNELRLWENDGTPFSGSWDYLAAADLGSLNALAAVDLDRDGWVDILAGCSSGAIQVLRNDGTPWDDSWDTSLDITGGLGESVLCLESCDFDRDGYLDIVAGRGGSGDDLWLFRNDLHANGDGNLWDDPWDTAVDIGSPGNNIETLATCDLDRDGHLDIVSGQSGAGDDIWLWRSELAAQEDNDLWDDPWNTSLDAGSAGNNIETLAICDLDRDGCLDIISGQSGAGDDIWLWQSELTKGNDGDVWNDAWAVRNECASLGANVNLLVVEDLDNDGKIDITGAVDSSTGGAELFALQMDDSPFSGSLSVLSIGNDDTNDFRAVCAADFDLDGDMDLATGREGTGDRVAVWENTLSHRNAVFSQPSSIGPFNDSLYALAAGDLNLDGDPDLASVGQFAVGSTGFISTWQNDGSPFSGNWTNQTAAELAGSPGRELVLGDLDNDGWPDLVSGHSDGKVYAWRNDETPFSGTWNSQLVVEASAGILGIALGDLDGDGMLDMAVCGNGNEIHVYQNDGSPFQGSWSEQLVSGTSSLGSPRDLTVVDLDGDGDLDLASGHANSSRSSPVYAWENDGSPFDGEWTGQLVGALDTNVTTIRTGDLDGDGWPELAAGKEDGTNEGAGYGNITIFWNDGSPFNDAWQNNTVGGEANDVLGLVLADFDLDGDLDIVSSHENNGAYLWTNDGSPFSRVWDNTSLGNGDSSVILAADLDGDRDPDLVSFLVISSSTEELHIWQNQGGCLGYDVSSTAPGSLRNSDKEDVLEIVVRHNGITGDLQITLDWWDILFEEAEDDPLSTAEAQSLFSNLYVYLDSDEDGDWLDEAGPFLTIPNTAISLSTGILRFSFEEDDDNVTLSPAGEKTYFLVVEMKEDAEDQGLTGFRLSFDADENSLGKNSGAATISVEDSNPVVVGPVQVVEFARVLVVVLIFGGGVVGFSRKRRRETYRFPARA